MTDNKKIMDKFDELIETQRDVSALLITLLKKESSQSELINSLGNAGMSSKRIAELLNTTQNTVNVTRSRSRNKQ